MVVTPPPRTPKTPLGQPNQEPSTQPQQAQVSQQPPYQSKNISQPEQGRRDGSHIIDYQIHGNEIQYLDIILDKNESVIAEPGALLSLDQSIGMESRMSDGGEASSGIFGKIFGAAKKSMARERLFMTFFTNMGAKRAKISLASPFPGTILPLNLGEPGGSILCYNDSFLAAAKGTSVGVGFSKKILLGLVGSETFTFQKIQGSGMAFILAGGAVAEHNLAAGETIFVETSSLLAYQSKVKMEIKAVKGVNNMAFGGTGLFISTMTGPGKVWVQSLSTTRLIQRINKMLAELNKGKAKKERKKMMSQMHKISRTYQPKG